MTILAYLTSAIVLVLAVTGAFIARGQRTSPRRLTVAYLLHLIATIAAIAGVILAPLAHVTPWEFFFRVLLVIQTPITTGLYWSRRHWVCRGIEAEAELVALRAKRTEDQRRLAAMRAWRQP
jgi:hypothetical protein